MCRCQKLTLAQALVARQPLTRVHRVHASSPQIAEVLERQFLAAVEQCCRHVHVGWTRWRELPGPLGVSPSPVLLAPVSDCPLYFSAAQRRGRVPIWCGHPCPWSLCNHVERDLRNHSGSRSLGGAPRKGFVVCHEVGQIVWAVSVRYSALTVHPPDGHVQSRAWDFSHFSRRSVVHAPSVLVTELCRRTGRVACSRPDVVSCSPDPLSDPCACTHRDTAQVSVHCHGHHSDAAHLDDGRPVHIGACRRLCCDSFRVGNVLHAHHSLVQNGPHNGTWCRSLRVISADCEKDSMTLVPRKKGKERQVAGRCILKHNDPSVCTACSALTFCRQDPPGARIVPSTNWRLRVTPWQPCVGERNNEIFCTISFLT